MNNAYPFVLKYYTLINRDGTIKSDSDISGYAPLY
jgi:hypothetical protein